MSETFNYFGDRARLSDTDDGIVLAVDIGGTRVSASAWTLANRLYAAGSDGMPSGDVSVTDRGMLERAGVPLRSDPNGMRVRLDQEPIASKFVVHAPQETPRRSAKHYSGGAPVNYVGHATADNPDNDYRPQKPGAQAAGLLFVANSERRETMTTKTKKTAETETIEFRPHPTSGYIGTRQTTPDAPFVAIEVPKTLADACRELDHRRDHGKHVSKIGGIDMLGEFELYGIPVVVRAFPKRGTGENAVWAIPRADFRFAVEH